MKKEETSIIKNEVKLAHIRLLAAILELPEEEVAAAIQEKDSRSANVGH